MKKNNAIVKKSSNLMGDSMIVNGDQLDISSMIYTIRGVQVMLDRDLAELSSVTPIGSLKGSASNWQKKRTTF